MKAFPRSVLLLFFVPLFVCAQNSREKSPANCRCDNFDLSAEIKVRDTGTFVEFRVESENPAILTRKFDWTISVGKIVEGLGTNRILADPFALLAASNSGIPSGFKTSSEPSSILFSRSRPKGERSVTVSVKLADHGPECVCKGKSITLKVAYPPAEINKPADVTDLSLSTDQLTLPCEPGRMPAPDVVVSDSMIIDVAVDARDPENDILLYNYTVSGGRIVGSGANVKWDLSTVYPGTYTITAGVDDGCGTCGKTQTRTVTIIACEPSCSLIDCPTIALYRPPDDEISPGENTFTANVSGGSQQSVTYEWIVSNGDFISGQGTPSIVVKFSEDSAKLPTSITLRVGGIDPRAACITEQTLIFENGRLKP